MLASRFAAWTRRRFGLASGAALAGLLGVDREQAAARKKRKRRCKRRFAPCTPGGKRKCCNTLKCGVPFELQGTGSTETRCCYGEGHSPCMVDNDCCYPAFCSGPNGECQVNSDRALKEHFASVDPADMLARVAALSITRWDDGTAGRRIGPATDDFAAVFGTGAAGHAIHPVDGQGVALAAIQGAAAEVARLRAQSAALGERLTPLERDRAER